MDINSLNAKLELMLSEGMKTTLYIIVLSAISTSAINALKPSETCISMDSKNLHLLSWKRDSQAINLDGDVTAEASLVAHREENQ